jgi:hypothetical protein
LPVSRKEAGTSAASAGAGCVQAGFVRVGFVQGYHAERVPTVVQLRRGRGIDQQEVHIRK